MSLVTTPQSAWVDSDEYVGVSQADTLVAPAAHFWDMHETGSPAFITDVIAGATITSNALFPVAGGIYVNCLATPTTGYTVAGTQALGGNDFMFLTCARSVADPVNPNSNGHTGFYWMWNGALGQAIKNQPVFAVALGTRTLPYAKNWIRTPGEIYTHAVVRRGDYIEYYCLPRGFIDSFSIQGEALLANIGACEYTYLGHFSYGTPANAGIGRQGTDGSGSSWTLPPGEENANVYVGQDYAGLAVYVFDNGAPTREQIVKCLRWVETEWTTKSSGKRLYPGFIGL